MNYFERYLSGEYEPVWQELFDLGSQVCLEPVYADALAVTAETMQRVRKNIEILIPRLVHIGFTFGYDYNFQPQFDEHDPIASHRSYLDAFFWARQQPPVFLPARQAEEEKRVFPQILGDDALDESEEELPDMAALIREMEQQVGAVPLSLKSWYEQVGGVNFYGHCPRWKQILQLPANQKMLPTSLMTECDPLMVEPLDKKSLASIVEDYQTNSTVRFDFAPDRYFKERYSGADTPYACELPDEHIDFLLSCFEPEKPVTFVQYLRTSLLTYAGFPGMARWEKKPTEDLDFLTQGLVAF